MKNKYIFSSILGGTFFAVPYLALGIGVLPSVAIGCAAFGAGTLIFKDKNIDLSLENEDNLYEILKKAKEMTKQLSDLSNKIESKEMTNKIKEICEISNKIIDTISKKPEKLKQARSFLNYYLPVTIKIIQRYDEIENQDLNTPESNKFMKSVQNMLDKIKHAFNEQLNNMYQTEMIDTNAEIKVFETMLKSDGFANEIDFNIENGGEKFEK